MGNNCTKQKLKLYEAKPSMILIIACTIISKLDENACDCLLIMLFLVEAMTATPSSTGRPVLRSSNHAHFLSGLNASVAEIACLSHNSVSKLRLQAYSTLPWYKAIKNGNSQVVYL